MRRRTLHLVLAAALSFLFSPVAVAAGSPIVVQAEVAHLLAHLQRSGCQVSRNGTWYSGAEAEDYLAQGAWLHLCNAMRRLKEIHS